MKLPLLLRTLVVLLLSFGSWSAAHASHLMGGEITYASVPATTAGVPRYRITVRKFFNSTSNPNLYDPTAVLTAEMGGCNAAATNRFQTTVTYKTLRYGLLCGPNTGPYQVVTYEADLDLPTGQWRISTYGNARTSGIQNLINPNAQDLYLEATIEASLTIQSTSPKFESILQPAISPAALSRYSFSTFDSDGDSLRYEQLLPYAGCNQPVAGTIPTHFQLNAGTGTYEPGVPTSAAMLGYYNTAVRVSEYRRINNRLVLIGSVMRDYLYLLQATTNQPPTFTSMQVNGGIAQPLSSLIAVPRGQTVNVLLQATDPDAGQTIHFESEAPSVVPGLSLTRVGTTNGLQLTWQVPATLPPGRYAIVVGVLDNTCLNASEERTLVFVVGSGSALATRPGQGAATDVFPTPFRERVQFTTTPNQTVLLVDALGREVARLTSTATGLVQWQPASTLPAGLYFARSAANGQPLARLVYAGK